jgi:TolB-like protein/Tfp pilus assembly protein PilF
MRSHAAIAQELDRDNPIVLSFLIVVYAALYDEEAALGLALRLAELRPNSSTSHYRVFISYVALGQTVAAISAFKRYERLASSDKHRGIALIFVGMCHFLEGQLAEAESALDASQSIQPGYFLALKWKAIIVAAGGNEQVGRSACPADPPESQPRRTIRRSRANITSVVGSDRGAKRGVSSPDIFISYNREDSAVAQTYRDALSREGFKVWWDATLRSGDNYDEVTEAALREAKAVVVLWSPRSVVSRWVRAEATIADRNKTLMPVTIEPCERPVMFELTQTANFCHWRGEADDKAWKAFREDVRRKVGRSGDAPAASTAPPPPRSASGLPNVAVLPITFRASEEGMEYLAEDLTEEITRELASFPLVKVIAASSMAAWRGKAIDNRALGREVDARFLIEGKLQRAGENARLTLQLIEAASGGVMWSSRLTRKLTDIETAPDVFAVSVAAEIGENLLQIEVGRAMTKTGQFTAWDHVLRFIAYASRIGSDAVRGKIAEARLALAAAPEFGMAHAMLASALGLQTTILGERLDDAQIHEIQVHIKRAMQLDANNEMVLQNLVSAYQGLGEYGTSLRFVWRAMEVNPNSVGSLIMLGVSQLYLGHFADAIATFTQHEQLSSFDAGRYIMLTHLGECQLLEGRADEAEDSLDQALALHPGFHLALKWKAIAAAQRGKQAEALAVIRQLREAEPELGIEQHVWQIVHNPHIAAPAADAVTTLRRLWVSAQVVA